MKLVPWLEVTRADCIFLFTVYKDPDTFSWENYLAETGASPAPPRAFKTRPPQGYKPGMKLEVVDKRVSYTDWEIGLH